MRSYLRSHYDVMKFPVVFVNGEPYSDLSKAVSYCCLFEDKSGAGCW